MKNVYLMPGFLASDMGILSTSQQIWWTPTLAAALGLGAMRLAADGFSPGPPDGEAMGVSAAPQAPWDAMGPLLQSQLGTTDWKVQVGPYDWRLDLNGQAASLAGNIRTHSTPAAKATIVGHSAGGLIAALAWKQLVSSGDTALVRRIITICTPFQGSYLPILWATGQLSSISQLLAIGGLAGLTLAQHAFWTLQFLNGLAFTWPAFYQLMPSLIGSEAAQDRNRVNLFTAANYPPLLSPSQPWLTFAQHIFQPLMADAATFPPDYVATYVWASGINTATALASSANPLQLTALAFTSQGDGVVTAGSQQRSPGLSVQVTGSHSSIPLGITTSGLLRDLILDPRGPISPPPQNVVILNAVPVNTTDAPESDYVTGLICLSGG